MLEQGFHIQTFSGWTALIFFQPMAYAVTNKWFAEIQRREYVVWVGISC